MRHGHLSTPFTFSGIDQQDINHLPAEQSYIPTGRAAAPEDVPFVGPMDHTLRGGVHSDPRWNLEGRASEYPSSNVRMEVQHWAPAFSGPPVDPYPHSSITGNRTLAPGSNVGNIHSSYYNGSSLRDVGGSVMNSTTGIGGPFKRKSPGISGACARGTSNSSYSAGSSSSSSQMLMEKPNVGCNGGHPYSSSSLSIAGEDSLRNVRSRSRLELEPSTSRTHIPSYSSRPHHSTPHPANYAAPVHPANPNADATSREWNFVPHYAVPSRGSISCPDTNVSRHATSQFHVGGSSANIDARHHDSVFSRHPASSSRYLHVPNAQAMREGQSNHSRRITPSYRNGPVYPHYVHGGSSSANGPHSQSESFSSRYSRHSSAVGWRNGYRSGRSRIAVERFQPIVDVVDDHDEMGHETFMMMDRASFYGSSRNLLDQYRDMRLDVDSMSYEELLALEERMGDVSTGLSEDSMAKCLRENVYCSFDNHEEVSCPICLEEYKNGEKIGTMEKCGHDYHVECIKKWLLLKKVCPICKSECSSQESTAV